MLKSMLAYQKTITSLLTANSPQTNWSQEFAYFSSLLAHLQHERLIHLLVTLTVGLATLISTLTTLSSPTLPLVILDFIFGILFLAYILHYRQLENTTQSCYPLLKDLHTKMAQKF